MRTSRNTRSLAVAGLLAAALVPAAGCGPDERESPTAVKLKAVGNMYLDYTVAKNGQGPDAEPALKAHIRAKPDGVLATSDIDRKNLDALFTSDRDGEPFAVLYGRRITAISGTDAPLVAHEKTGRNGRRLVVFANGKVDLVDETRLQQLLAAKQ